MADRIFLFLLKRVIPCVAVIMLTNTSVIAAEEETAPLNIKSEQLIQPEVQRREIKLADIDTEDFEVTAFYGILSVEDFGVNPVYGARFAYHVNEDLFVESTLGFSRAGQTSYERISGTPLPLVSDEERNITYYNVSLGYNLLPGESFLTKNTSFNSTIYVSGGMGSTTFAGSDRLTINLGGGFRLLATDFIAFKIDVRDHIFNIDVLAEDKTAHNIELTFALSIFF